MVRLITKDGCCRCVLLKSKIETYYSSEYMKGDSFELVNIHGTKYGGFVGLGDVVEFIIHFLSLNVLWAWLHFKKADWKCPGCRRRKHWLNKLWFFGDKASKAIWLEAVYNSPSDSQYPFVGYQDRHGKWHYNSLGEEHEMVHAFTQVKGLAYYEQLFKH